MNTRRDNKNANNAGKTERVKQLEKTKRKLLSSSKLNLQNGHRALNDNPNVWALSMSTRSEVKDKPKTGEV